MAEITVTLDAEGRGTIMREGIPAQLVRAEDLVKARTKALTKLREWAAAGPVDALIQEPSSSFRVRVYGSGKVEPIAADPADEPRPSEVQDMPPIAPGERAPQPRREISDARFKFFVVAIVSFVGLGMICLTILGLAFLQTPQVIDFFSLGIFSSSTHV